MIEKTRLSLGFSWFYDSQAESQGYNNKKNFIWKIYKIWQTAEFLNIWLQNQYLVHSTTQNSFQFLAQDDENGFYAVHRYY